MIQKLLVTLGFCAAAWGAAERPLVFPEPDKMEKLAAGFALDESVRVLADDLRLARLLAAEVSDRYGVALKVERASALPAEGPLHPDGPGFEPAGQALRGRARDGGDGGQTGAGGLRAGVHAGSRGGGGQRRSKARSTGCNRCGR